jgi:hypothetical protein
MNIIEALIGQIQVTRSKLAHGLDPVIQTAYALHKVASFNRIKIANLSDQEIHRVVLDHLKTRGVENAPKVNWGKLFKAPLINLGRRRGWNWERTQTIIDLAFQNILLGFNLDTGNSYAAGDLAQRVLTLQEEGKSDTEIQKLLSHALYQSAIQVYRNMTMDNGRDEFDIKGITSDPEEGGESSMAMEKVLNLDTLSKSEAVKWMSLAQRDPELRGLIRNIDKYIQTKGGADVTLLWQAIKANPDYKNEKELGRAIVEISDPDTGKRIKVPLHEAFNILGHTKMKRVDNAFNIWKKLRNLLTNIKGDVLEALHEKERA